MKDTPANTEDLTLSDYALTVSLSLPTGHPNCNCLYMPLISGNLTKDDGHSTKREKQ